MKPRLSLIIASYNAETTIQGCLQSLADQIGGDAFEIIIIDSSSDKTPEIVNTYFPQVRFFHFNERKYCGDARNIGISKAKADIVAFIDADCTAEKNWVQEILKAHQSDNLAIGGAIANGTQGGYITWASYFCEFSQWMPRTAKQWMKDVAGANISYKRDIFEKYGTFIEGTYCSDTEFHWRMIKDGIRILFDPSLCVTHHSIDTLSRFLRHEKFHGKCFARVRSKAFRFSFLKRFSYGMLSPLLPARLFWKIYILNRKNKIYWHSFLKAIPLLILGIASWSLGEAAGYFTGE